MFRTIVGALVFYYIGLPVIMFLFGASLLEDSFWLFLLAIVAILIII